jgi:hypothetical protein
MSRLFLERGSPEYRQAPARTRFRCGARIVDRCKAHVGTDILHRYPCSRDADPPVDVDHEAKAPEDPGFEVEQRKRSFWHTSSKVGTSSDGTASSHLLLEIYVSNLLPGTYIARARLRFEDIRNCRRSGRAPARCLAVVGPKGAQGLFPDELEARGTILGSLREYPCAPWPSPNLKHT